MKIIFTHGLGQTPSSWEETLAYLPVQMKTACPHLFELVQGEEISYEKLYAAYEAYCNQFTPPFHLCGISLGAILALNYAIDYPNKVYSLVTIAPQFKMPGILIRWQSMMFHCLPKKYFSKSGVEKEHLIQLSQSMIHLNLKDDLDKIHFPVLVICGRKDYVNRQASKEMVKLLSNATFYFIKGAGHEVNRDAPQALAIAIEEFYNEVI